MPKSLPQPRAPRLFSLEEAAVELGVSVRTVARWIGNGEIQSEKVGRLRRIDASQLEKFLNRRKDKGHA